MLLKNEMKVLEKLLDDYTKSYSINELSRVLNQKYAQTYNTVEGLRLKNLVRIDIVGNNKLVNLDLDNFHFEYVFSEYERSLKVLKTKEIKLIREKLLLLEEDFSCILFGSHSKFSVKDKSDVDLLFVVNPNVDLSKFEKKVKSALGIYNVDVNIITDVNLFEMWNQKNKLNLGNEVLKNHYILTGIEKYIKLVAKRYG